MLDVEFRRMMMNDRLENLQHDAARPARAPRSRRLAEMSEIALRLCRESDTPALERLAALAERPVPCGRMLLALAGGKLVAALPLSGGPAITDPFTRTAHVTRLLELQAAQLRPPAPRWRVLGRHA